MNSENSLAAALADAIDALLAGISRIPPFSWATALVEWLDDELARWAEDKLAALERDIEKEDHMETWYMRDPEEAKRTEEVGALGGIPAAEAAENIRENMKLLDRPPLPERVREEFRQIFTEKIHRPGAEKLLDWLDRNEFFTAPASSKHHLAIPGGLALHSLNVYRRLVEIAEKEEDGQTPAYKTQAAPPESIAIMALLHDVCKTDCYHRDPATGAYKFRDPLPMGHGEKSVYMITRYMELYPTEAMAIRWHMGAYDDAVKGGSKAFNEAMRMTPWVWRLHQADMIAAWEDERSGDNGNT